MKKYICLQDAIMLMLELKFNYRRGFDDPGTVYMMEYAADEMMHEIANMDYIENVEKETKNGEWVNSHISGEDYICSVCGGGSWYYDQFGNIKKSRFCPNCGAKMDL